MRCQSASESEQERERGAERVWFLHIRRRRSIAPTDQIPDRVPQRHLSQHDRVRTPSDPDPPTSSIPHAPGHSVPYFTHAALPEYDEYGLSSPIALDALSTLSAVRDCHSAASAAAGTPRQLLPIYSFVRLAARDSNGPRPTPPAAAGVRGPARGVSDKSRERRLVRELQEGGSAPPVGSVCWYGCQQPCKANAVSLVKLYGSVGGSAWQGRVPGG